jgi:hypothetical protein
MTLNLNNNAKQFRQGRYSYVLATLRFAIRDSVIVACIFPSQLQLLAALVICARTGRTFCQRHLHITVISTDSRKSKELRERARLLLLPSIS